MIPSLPSLWTCPHCNRDTTITYNDIATGSILNRRKNADGYQKVEVLFVVCPNPECRKYTLSCSLFTLLQAEARDIHGQRDLIDPEIVDSWQLVPSSKAKVFPDYVPQSIREDYEEACLIVDLSPKAAASLARRCLQGMIRDFWGVKKKNLLAEIEAIEEKVDPNIWNAIDSVRKIGNIGAHMGKDVNLIIDIEVEEAEKLIWLIEFLIEDWYVRRAEREAKLQELHNMAQEKEQQRQPAQGEGESGTDFSEKDVK